MNLPNLPFELINHILTFRPIHPIAKLLKEEIEEFKEDIYRTKDDTFSNYVIKNNRYYYSLRDRYKNKLWDLRKILPLGLLSEHYMYNFYEEGYNPSGIFYKDYQNYISYKGITYNARLIYDSD
jgi:hypothetical protein